MAALAKHDPSSGPSFNYLLEFVVNHCILKIQRTVENNSRLWNGGICAVLRSWHPESIDNMEGERWIPVSKLMNKRRDESLPFRKTSNKGFEWLFSSASVRGWALTLANLFESLGDALLDRAHNPDDIDKLKTATSYYSTLAKLIYNDYNTIETILTSTSLASLFRQQRKPLDLSNSSNFAESHGDEDESGGEENDLVGQIFP